MYYIHYRELDKRLDEWVSASSVISKVEKTDGIHRVGSGGSGGSGLLPEDSNQKMTRRQKRQYAEINHLSPSVEDLPPMDQYLEKEHQEKTKVKNIQVIELGRHEIDTWYFSPYP